ncbi:MAG: sigma-70 family RNA polymerase sigma factor [Phycisphaeraceae bacterium]|nr:MAG: sigma-70 family RNA polymerase sigma factor [Phycisphaeraceae bacterium]
MVEVAHRPPNQPPTTSLTLLGRLSRGDDAEAWREFDGRYRGLIVRYLRGRGLQVADAEDCAQAVMGKLVRGLRNFKYDSERGGFRAYLYRCTRSALSDFAARMKRNGRVLPLDAVVGVNGSQADDDSGYAVFEQEWVDHHYRLAVSRYLDVSEGHGSDILRATLAGTPARVIGERLGMTENGVHKAQQRLRERLKALIAEQVRDEELGDG